MMKETNFSGSVEYITATSALSGITLVPSDRIRFYSDQRETSKEYCKSYLRKLEEVLSGVEDQGTSVITDVPRTTSTAFSDGKRANLIAKYELLEAEYDAA